MKLLFLFLCLNLISCKQNSIKEDRVVNGVNEIKEDISSQFYLRRFIVDTTSTVLYETPNFESEKIETLVRNQEITFLAMKDNWVKIKVKNNGNVGYVIKDDIWINK